MLDLKYNVHDINLTIIQEVQVVGSCHERERSLELKFPPLTSRVVHLKHRLYQYVASGHPRTPGPIVQWDLSFLNGPSLVQLDRHD